MEGEYESTNIHLKWLENIYGQLRMLQDFERIAREGCKDLMEYLQIPIQMHLLVMPDAQYKNLRFMALELDILIGNLSPVLKDKEKQYKESLSPVLKNINNRKMFLQEIKNNNQLVRMNLLPFMYSTIEYLSRLKAELIKDIGHILYLPEVKEKKW